jgi:hypothetical protein
VVKAIYVKVTGDYEVRTVGGWYPNSMDATVYPFALIDSELQFSLVSAYVRWSGIENWDYCRRVSLPNEVPDDSHHASFSIANKEVLTCDQYTNFDSKIDWRSVSSCFSLCQLMEA